MDGDRLDRLFTVQHYITPNGLGVRARVCCMSWAIIVKFNGLKSLRNCSLVKNSFPSLQGSGGQKVEVRVRWERKRLKEKKGKRKQAGMGRFSGVSKDRDASFLNKALSAKHGSSGHLKCCDCHRFSSCTRLNSHFIYYFNVEL